MASHLTIISGNSGASASVKAFAGQQTGAQDATKEPKGLLGLFSALLSGADAATIAEAAPAGLTTDRPGHQSGEGLAGLFRLALQNGIGGETGDGSTEPGDSDVIAAPVDPSAIGTVPADPAAMVNFVEALSALKVSLDNGEPLDSELLEQVETALSELAEALDLDLDTLDVPEDFAALLETTGTDETGLAGVLTQLLMPLATSLDTAQPATDAEQAAAAGGASAQLKALGDKLAALLAALEDGQVSAEKLAALGMTPGEPLDAEIEAALSRFTAGLSAQAANVPDEPILSAPALKLTEPVLAGQTTPADAPETLAAAPRPASDPADAGGQQNDAGDSSADDRGRDRAEQAPREARSFTPPSAPAAADASGNPTPTADASAQQATGARVDAAANPRIIQAGYQTSQQQLNLPQLAFELARQVQDGNTRFQIRLDPPELGRIDVRLDIDQSGQVSARLMVEKSETLDLMQRDQRGLERALQQAGLDSAKTNLEFSLKQNPFAGQQGQMGEGKGQNGTNGGLNANDNGLGNGEAEETPPMVNLYRGALQASGVNIIA